MINDTEIILRLSKKKTIKQIEIYRKKWNYEGRPRFELFSNNVSIRKIVQMFGYSRKKWKVI